MGKVSRPSQAPQPLKGFGGKRQIQGIPKPKMIPAKLRKSAAKDDSKAKDNARTVRINKLSDRTDAMSSSRFILMKGATMFRMRLVCSLLSGKAIRIDDIRPHDARPGLRDYEVSFLRLLDRISSGTAVKISPTGTSVKFTPGVILGGADIEHECPPTRAIGYFVEPLLALAPFGKAALSIRLSGCVTNMDSDLSADIIRAVTIPLLRHFGMGAVDLGGFRSAAPELKIVKRGAPPSGGGVVQLTCPIVKTLEPVNLTDPGRIKKVRGLAYTTRCSASIAQRMAGSVRGVFNSFIPDVFVYTDHFKGKDAGATPGYAVGLAAESTTGCLLSAQRTAMTASVLASMGAAAAAAAGAGAPAGGSSAAELMEMSDQSLIVPEDVGRVCAKALLEEISEGGCIDANHQSLFCLLMAMGPEDVSRVRVGKLSPHAVATLRLIRDFWKLQFKITPDPATKTVILSCLGTGFVNMARKSS